MSSRFFALAVLALVAVFAIAACDSEDASGDPGAYTVDAAEAIEMIESGERTIIDVRTPGEFAEARIVGAVNIDVNAPDFGDRIAELDVDEPYLVYCRSGNRSAQAAEQMVAIGIKDIADAGGLETDLAPAGAPIE